MDLKRIRNAYSFQKSNAKARGIEWTFTFETWLAWWGDDIQRRGQGHDKLQMQRIGDAGAYEPGNVRKGYPRDNAKTHGNNMRHHNSVLARKRIEKKIDAAPTIQRRPTAYEAQGEALQTGASGRDSHYFDRMFRIRSSFQR